MRLIDADELNKFPIRLDHYDKKQFSEHFVYGIESVLEYVEYLPTVDAVPVTRCKDCKHRDPEDKRCDCGCWHTPFATNDNDFCSYGERKDISE